MPLQPLKYVLLLLICLSACTIVKKQQQAAPFIVKNNIVIAGGKLSKEEQIAIKSRLSSQLDDSAGINVIDKFFLWHVYEKPPAFDTVYAARSTKNMVSSMLHLGYYSATGTYQVDTAFKKTAILSFKFKSGKFPFYVQKQQRVTVTYKIQPEKATVIDTISYRMRRPDLQALALEHINKSLLQKKMPVTKAAVLGEISRLVDLYRNHGYYKFTAEELKVRGDTTLEALTSISDDPFEQLQLLAEAQQKKDSPKIKLAVVLNPPLDTTRLKQYHINNIYVLPDYRPGDKLTDSLFTVRITDSLHIVRYRNKLYRSSFLSRNIFLKKGDLYNQAAYYKTLNSFSRAGVWQSVNIDIIEPKDSSGKIDLIIQLIPAPQFSFEASLETSYSANSNTNTVSSVNAGNLLGLSGNVSLTNRNLAKEGIKWTNALRAGVEFNLSRGSTNTLINSNEIGLTSTAVIPRSVKLFNLRLLNLNNKPWSISPQTFANASVSYINRFNLFNLQSFNLGFGYSFRNRRNGEWTIKPFNVEFTRLFGESPEFTQTLIDNPFLLYSFNTALVAGNLNMSYAISRTNPKNANHQHSFKTNVEESGLLFGELHLFEKYLRKFIKVDMEYTYSRSRAKSALINRVFLGVGTTTFNDPNTSLPFFKQYFGGGSNSMRGWPVRGIGRGSQPLAPYDNNNRFNDRTGDLQVEYNVEYRYNIGQIIPDLLLLKGAFFMDAGNIWNVRTAKPNGGTDSALFVFKNIWRDLGVNAGLGFRLDFKYIVVRLDLGFRFKRPEMAYVDNGWKIPALGFNDAFQKIFTRGPNDEYRRWRYENFNFTFGINYPF